jgi:diguanylate cyclase (GGDEF)-like protein
MNDEQSQNRLNELAVAVLEALSELSHQGGGLNVERLAEFLGQRPECQAILEIVEEKEKQGPEIVQKYEDLKEKFNKTREHMMAAEAHAGEVEDAFKDLVLVLSRLARDPQNASLNQQLAQLKQTLNQKADPGLLSDAISQLKNQLMHDEDPDEDDAGGPVPTSVPDKEGISDNIRDVLLGLVRDISLFEIPETQEKAKDLVDRINSSFSLDNYEPFIQDIRDIIFLVKEALRQDKQELHAFTQELVQRLEETEKDFLNSIDQNANRLGDIQQDFAKGVAADIKGIEKSLETGSIQEIRSKVFEKIASIRERFKRLQMDDDKRLRQLEEEKEGVERRLEEVHRRYQGFADRSRQMLEEMEKLRQTSLSDPLTGSFNRRAYDVQIVKAIEELAQGRIKRFSLIVFDIDNFKIFNNTYGHRAGDKILTYVARFTTQSLRKEDLLFRYGGDEFVILLTEADLKAAAKTADKIREGVHGVEFKIFKGSDKTARVGLSMGVAEAKSNDDPKTLFSRADKALYRAKEKGRNQVCTEK